MSSLTSAGARFRDAIAQETPLQVVGVINAYAARLAEASGFKALYISGGGVAAGSCGVPDLGVTTMEDVLIDVRRVTDITDLPLLVDIDTGPGLLKGLTPGSTARSSIELGHPTSHPPES